MGYGEFGTTTIWMEWGNVGAAGGGNWKPLQTPCHHQVKVPPVLCAQRLTWISGFGLFGFFVFPYPTVVSFNVKSQTLRTSRRLSSPCTHITKIIVSLFHFFSFVLF